MANSQKIILAYNCEAEETDDAEDEINEEWFGESKE